MATGFIADTASIPFTVSNLVNLVTAGYFNITFLRYTEIMIIPDLISIIASVAVLYIFYRSELKNYAANTDIKPEDLIKDKRIFKNFISCHINLNNTVFYFWIYKNTGVIYINAVCSLFYLMARLDKRIDANRVIKIAPWQIVLFSLGMYIIVFGVSNEGLNLIYVYVLQHINNVLPPFNFILSGFFFAFNAAIMNNLPSVMIGDIAISGLKNPGLLMYANVIGNDIGPKFTPIGSLATLLWLYTLERKMQLKYHTGII